MHCPQQCETAAAADLVWWCLVHKQLLEHFKNNTAEVNYYMENIDGFDANGTVEDPDGFITLDEWCACVA